MGLKQETYEDLVLMHCEYVKPQINTAESSVSTLKSIFELPPRLRTETSI